MFHFEKTCKFKTYSHTMDLVKETIKKRIKWQHITGYHNILEGGNVEVLNYSCPDKQ